MRAIILGANGYIGKHLADYLNLLNWDITCYDIHPDSIFPDSSNNYFKLDITDKEKMIALVIYILDKCYFRIGNIHYFNKNEDKLLHTFTITFCNHIVCTNKQKHKQ